MKAIVQERYGPPEVLEMREVDKPTVDGDQILIRVRAASVNRSDWEELTARPAYVRVSGGGFWKPKRPIPGSDVAGEVEAVGPAATRFRPGDEVFGDILWHGLGAFAEFVSVSERAPLVLKPPGVAFEQAAVLPQAGVLGLQGLKYRRETQRGDRVLIMGAGGGAGTFAVQLAKLFGAEVTGVDATSKLDMMRAIGADHVVDYTREHFATGGRRYDRIIDFASDRTIFTFMRALRPDGIYAMVGGSVPRLLQTAVLGAAISKLGSKEMHVLMAKPNREDLTHLAGLVESGAITPVIDRRYELSEVPEALRYLGDERVKGKIVVTI